MGKNIVTFHAERRLGDKMLKLLSSDLQTKLPGIKGLSKQVLDMPKDFIYFFIMNYRMAYSLGAS